MFRNLLALLFLFALALPAVAVAAPVADSNMAIVEDCHGMPMEHDDKAPAGEHALQHGCIGCIAPYAPAIAVISTPELVAAPLPGSTVALSGYALKPHDPPPRNEM